MAEPPEHLSPSGWSLWQQCPRAWAAKYVDGIDPPVGWQAEVGTFAHRVLEILMGGPPRSRSGTWARAVAHDTWGSTPTESIARGEITEADFKRRAWHAITGLWGLEEPAEVEVVATEREFNWREGDVPMKVIVDRIDRHGRDSFTPGLVIVDYKTGKLPDEFYVNRWGKRCRSKRRDKVKRQITIGAMAVASDREHRLEVAHSGSLLYLSADEAIGAPTDPKAREAVHRDAQGVWEAINLACETEEFKPEPSVLCQWCPVVGDCDAGQLRIVRMEEGEYNGYQPDSPGAKLVAALDAA